MAFFGKDFNRDDMMNNMKKLPEENEASYRETILKLYPDSQAPLVRLLKGAQPVEEKDVEKFAWWNDKLVEYNSTLAEAEAIIFEVQQEDDDSSSL